MARKKKEPKFYPSLEITNAGSEGKCIARVDGKVILIERAVPGDIADVKTTYQKHKYEEGHIEKLIKASEDRIETFCEHISVCGGCKWQQMSYPAQLQYKQQQVFDAFQRIGKFEFPESEEIIGSENVLFYRNKLEYSFTHKKWLTQVQDKESMSENEHPGLGFHIPGRFDKVFDVQKCWLMDDLNNAIRNEIRSFAIANKYSFFDLYEQKGLLRNLILRNNTKGEWMLIVCFGQEDKDAIQHLLQHLADQFPQISALLYVINEKRNDTIFDLPVLVFKGNNYLIESLEGIQFKIGPKSFFQTNTHQTLNLYGKAREFAQLKGDEIVYDLYTGVGTIALFMAKLAKKIVGIEYVPQAIEDAKENAALNNIEHAHFYAGDMKDCLSDDLIALHGKADVIITDPPRAGMHADVCQKLMELKAPKIVYISCNPATQARDIAMMDAVYKVTKVQAVDMFPHTHHVENIALLELR
jgi:23S rRNA (uracil1939-C5)-methyltransferase